MTHSKIKIKDLIFNENLPMLLDNSDFYKEWPVVYILNNNDEMYIGETYHSCERMKQHLKNPKRKVLKDAHIIACEDFTKSATLDIESSLIELCSSIEDGKTLQNETNGLVKHNYANKQEFAQDSLFFKHLWLELSNRGLVNGSIENLKNSDLFKYSPYKSLNAEQCTTRDFILEDIKNDFCNNKKQTIFVNGSAGTGKSILAVYLMKLLITNADYLTEDDESELLPFIADLKEIRKLKPDLKIAYVVAMTSFRSTLKEAFKHINGLSANMVIGPNEVANEEYDILIVDEAHRLMKRKNLTGYGEYDKVNRKLGLKCDKSEDDGTQLDWIMKQSKVQILFYDSSQSIKPTDINEEDFKKLISTENNAQYFLSSQMRCQGGMDYLKYIENILNLNQLKKEFFNSKYELKLFENINEFCEAVLDKENKYGLARIVSGYGFEWKSKPKKGKPNKNKDDIIIDNRKFIWNISNKRWPITINGNRVVNEVGCIHTIQGYDLNYCGVIFGPEICFVNERVEINRNCYFDAKGKNGVSDNEKLKQYIINIYKVLMTRGIKGTYVYVCDDGLRNYFKRFF